MPSINPTSSISRLRRWGGAHPALYYLVPPTAWILFVAWASLAPPDDLPYFEFQWADKLEHAASYAVLAALLLRAWTRHETPALRTCLVLGVVAAAWGFYLEILQKMVGYRTFDVTDALANAAGAAIGLAAWSALAHWRNARSLAHNVPIVP